jgi:hypothetical protein
VFGRSLRFGVRRSVLCRCVWQESGFSRREDVFTFNLSYRDTSEDCANRTAQINDDERHCMNVLLAMSFTNIMLQ